MTLNGVIAVILGYFTEFRSFWSQLCQSRWSKTDIICEEM